MGYETPRPRTDAEPRDIPPLVQVLLFVIAVVVALGMTVHAACVTRVRAQADEKPTITHSSLAPTYTYDGEVIRWYVFVDPDTGVQYLYNDHSWVATPRLDRDGEQMGTLDERGQ